MTTDSRWLLAVAAAAGAAALAAAEPPRFVMTDAAGRTVSLAAPPQRLLVVGDGPFIVGHLLAAFPEGRERLIGLEHRGRGAEDVSAGRVTSEVVNVPERLASVAVRWRLPGLPARLDLDGTYMDDVYTSLPSAKFPGDPVRRVGSYSLTDLRAGVDVVANLELWAAVRNLFDVDYESEYTCPGPGRSYSFGLSGKL